jgi:hypothetical protein
MRHARNTCLALALALAMLGRASAQAPAASAQSEYEIALSQALDAHARGEYEAARLFMERAHGLEPSARTLRGLAIVAFAQGRHLDAIRQLDAALESKVKPLPDELRTAAQELLAHAWAQLGRYEVVVDPPDGDFLVDGAAPDLYAERTIVLVPGPHVITARARTRAPYELKFESRAGARETLHVVLAVPPQPEVVEKIVYRKPAIDAARATPERLVPGFYTPGLRWAALGTGSALLITGVSLWGVGYTRLKEVDARCADMEPAGCTPADARKRYDRRHIGAFAISSSVVGGLGAAVLVGVGAVELWLWRQRDRRTELRAGLGSLQLEARF